MLAAEFLGIERSHPVPGCTAGAPARCWACGSIRGAGGPAVRTLGRCRVSILSNLDVQKCKAEENVQGKIHGLFGQGKLENELVGDYGCMAKRHIDACLFFFQLCCKKLLYFSY